MSGADRVDPEWTAELVATVGGHPMESVLTHYLFEYLHRRFDGAISEATYQSYSAYEYRAWYDYGLMSVAAILSEFRGSYYVRGTPIYRHPKRRRDDIEREAIERCLTEGNVPDRDRGPVRGLLTRYGRVPNLGTWMTYDMIREDAAAFEQLGSVLSRPDAFLVGARAIFNQPTAHHTDRNPEFTGWGTGPRPREYARLIEWLLRRSYTPSNQWVAEAYENLYAFPEWYRYCPVDERDEYIVNTYIDPNAVTREDMAEAARTCIGHARDGNYRWLADLYLDMGLHDEFDVDVSSYYTRLPGEPAEEVEPEW